MDQFCGSKFWDRNVTWNTNNPDFTECFMKTVLIWVPCAFLWVFTPLELYCMRTSTRKTAPTSWLFVLKLALTFSLIILTIADLAVAIYYSKYEEVYNVEYTTPSIKIISFAIASLLLVYNKDCGLPNSGILFLFWFFLAIFGIVQLRRESNNLAYQDKATYSAVSYVVYYVLVCITSLSNYFADGKAKVSDDAKDKKVCPQENASLPSKLLFTAFDVLAWKGFRKPLEHENLWAMEFKDTAKGTFTTFEKYWTESLQSSKNTQSAKMSFGKGSGSLDLNHARKKTVSILPALWKSFRVTILAGGFLKLLEGIVILTSPQILRLLIGFVSGNQLLWKGYLYAAMFLIVKAIGTLVSTQQARCMYLSGLRMRTALIGAIYQKALKIANSARKDSTVGEIVNLMSVDSQAFMDLTIFIHSLWESPLEIAVALYFLYDILGPSVFAGIGVMILLVPLHAVLANRLLSLKTGQMDKKDERVKLINEILNGIKVLKLYAWEPSFEQQISKIRGDEMTILTKHAYCATAMIFLWTCAPPLVCLAALATYVTTDDSHVLDAEKVFVSLTLFNMIQTPLITFPEIIARCIQTMVSLKRINKFMNSDELDPNNVQHDKHGSYPLVIENGKFAWEPDASAKPVLDNINVQVKENQLVAIVGSVGSGKSSLLSAFLGEMDRLSGRINTQGTMAYVSQQAWIQNATVRDNILFGKPFVKKLYNRVVEACALRTDFEMLAAGDRTEIGEKGINLSGGQKQRISLARAVYNGADVYLFDDPLSAVDSHVGKHIFENVIGPDGLLKDKTRVLVTHGISYLPHVDNIFVLKGGEISERGTYSELLKKRGAFAEFLLHHLQQGGIDMVNEDEELGAIAQQLESEAGTPVFEVHGEPQFPTNNVSNRSSNRSSMRSMSRQQSKNEFSPRRSLRRSSTKEDAMSEIFENNELIEMEKLEVGKVKWKVYSHYLRAIGWILTVSAIVTRIGSEVFNVGANFWLSVWTSDNTTIVDGVMDHAKRDTYLGVYGGFIVLQAIFVMFALFATAIGCTRSSRLLHGKLLFGIMRIPVGFFDVTPSGRILNRFGKDIDIVDNILPRIIKIWLFSMVTVVGTIVVISYSTPIFIAVVVPMAVIYYFIQCFYLTSTRQLIRLESITRSPMYSHAGESIAGAQTIRAYCAQERFIIESERRIDNNHVCSYTNVIADRWLTVRLEMMGNLVIFFAALFAVLQRDTLSAGIVGLSVSYALQVTSHLEWLVRSSSELESNIISVERINEYCQVPHEAPWEIPEHIPDKSWPDEGSVEFRDYKLRYREGLDLALRGLTFTVAGGEKVGIVGRTGAGKSSLTLALFRIIEGAGGRILIDDIDIATIGLHSLRSKLTIIPQDPVLFSGSLRMNLDPFDKYTDDEVWRALEHAHLKEYAEGLKGGLMHEITEGGDNLSVGQRQLICLARALLRKTKVLILDEATASVDMETDDFIQHTIRQEFSDCTILTIAHRLNTILDSDKVLVLDRGYIAEFDSPNKLLQNPTSQFYSMAKDAGLVE